MLKNKKNLLKYLIFFLAVAGYFIFLQSSQTFADPDSFYHAKITSLMAQGQIIIHNFPWIKFASFNQNFTDQHFLYHLMAAPFVMIFTPLWGLKIFTILLGSLFIVFFYSFLKRWQIRWPWFYTLLLLAVPPFVFRINLAKASALSLIILLISLSLIWQKRYYALAILSFLYVWAYGGWSLLLLLVICDLIAQILINKTLPVKQQNFQFPISNFQYLESILKNINWRPAQSILIGIISGLILNPYFPHNLQFYWQQLVQIGFVNYQGILNVGQEWYPYPILEFLANNVFVFILSFLAFGAFFWKIKQKDRILRSAGGQNFRSEDAKAACIRSEEIFVRRATADGMRSSFQKIFTLFLFAGFLGVATLKSQRFIEYFSPFLILANAWLLNFSLPINFDPFKLFRKGAGHRCFDLFLAVFIFICFTTIFSLKSGELHNKLTQGIKWDFFQPASAWLKNNTPASTLIYHTNWSDFPMLFYHNNYNTYLAGLDPTFFYLYNRDLYKEWAEINQGEIKDQLAEKIKNDFGAHWLLLKNIDKKLLEQVSVNPDFSLRYDQDEIKIYEIK